MRFIEARDFLTDNYAATRIMTTGHAVDILNWARRQGFAYAGAYIVQHGPMSDTFLMTLRDDPADRS